LGSVFGVTIQGKHNGAITKVAGTDSAEIGIFGSCHLCLSPAKTNHTQRAIAKLTSHVLASFVPSRFTDKPIFHSEMMRQGQHPAHSGFCHRAIDGSCGDEEHVVLSRQRLSGDRTTLAVADFSRPDQTERRSGRSAGMRKSRESE